MTPAGRTGRRRSGIPLSNGGFATSRRARSHTSSAAIVLPSSPRWEASRAATARWARTHCFVVWLCSSRARGPTVRRRTRRNEVRVRSSAHDRHACGARRARCREHGVAESMDQYLARRRTRRRPPDPRGLAGTSCAPTIRDRRAPHAPHCPGLTSAGGPLPTRRRGGVCRDAPDRTLRDAPRCCARPADHHHPGLAPLRGRTVLGGGLL